MDIGICLCYVVRTFHGYGMDMDMDMDMDIEARAF